MISTTYTPDFEIAIKILLSPQIEGGYSDQPNDSGGVTNMGVTARLLQDYNNRHNLNWEIKNLTKDQAREIYFDEFWVPLELHHLHSQELKNVVFATAVNRGLFASVHSLQYCANMPQDQLDGKMGPKTIAYVNAEIDPVWLTNRYCDFQREAYERSSRIWYIKDANYGWRPVEPGTPGAVQKNLVFVKGWVRRINNFVIPIDSKVTCL